MLRRIETKIKEYFRNKTKQMMVGPVNGLSELGFRYVVPLQN